MYNSFFGFDAKPFLITPDPRFLYLSPNHRQALTHLEYGLLDNIGLMVLTGEVGTGKTTTIRFIVEHLCGDKALAVIYHTNLPPNEFFRLILNSFDLQPKDDHKDTYLETFVQFLKLKQSQKSQVLIIIDEAQGLSEETLEEVRLLTNIQIDFADVLQIMMMGQPEFLATLESGRWASLSQRIGINYHLTGLDPKQTCLYIAYRLNKVGGNSNLFTLAALKQIFRASQGIPRRINIICDAALIYAYGEDMKVIDESVIRKVIKGRIGLGLKQEVNNDLDVRRAKKSAVNGNGHIEKRLQAVEKTLKQIQNQLRSLGEDITVRGTKSKGDLIVYVKTILTNERRMRKQLEQEIVKLKKQIQPKSVNHQASVVEPSRELSKTAVTPVEVEKSGS